MDFDKVYFQKETDGAAVKETVASFDVYCSEMPFVIANKAKDLTTRNWHDEDGLDAYVPSVLKMEAYELEVKFICKGDRDSSNQKIRNFIDYLTGRDGSGVYLKVYDSYTEIGRQHVRFTELSDKAELVRDADGDILVFTVKFNVDDPVTDIKPTKGANGEITKLS